MTLQAQLVPSTLDEETARAEVYGLLSALYYAPPPAELISNIRVAVTEAPAAGALLEASWGELVAAARKLIFIAASRNSRRPSSALKPRALTCWFDLRSSGSQNATLSMDWCGSGKN